MFFRRDYDRQELIGRKGLWHKGMPVLPFQNLAGTCPGGCAKPSVHQHVPALKTQFPLGQGYTIPACGLVDGGESSLCATISRPGILATGSP